MVVVSLFGGRGCALFSYTGTWKQPGQFSNVQYVHTAVRKVSCFTAFQSLFNTKVYPALANIHTRLSALYIIWTSWEWREGQGQLQYFFSADNLDLLTGITVSVMVLTICERASLSWVYNIHL